MSLTESAELIALRFQEFQGETQNFYGSPLAIEFLLFIASLTKKLLEIECVDCN